MSSLAAIDTKSVPCTLLQAARKNRASHAYVFCAAALDELRQTAFISAAYLLSPSQFEDSSALDVIYRQVEAGHHPDGHCIGPQGLARQIRIDQIRDLQNKISLTAAVGSVKIVITKKLTQ